MITTKTGYSSFPDRVLRVWAGSEDSVVYFWSDTTNSVQTYTFGKDSGVTIIEDAPPEIEAKARAWHLLPLIGRVVEVVQGGLVGFIGEVVDWDGDTIGLTYRMACGKKTVVRVPKAYAVNIKPCPW